MNLNLALIAHHLMDWKPVPVNLEDDGLDICDVRLCPANTVERDSIEYPDRTLFIGTFDQFRALSFTPLHALCAGGDKEAVDYFKRWESQALVLPPGALPPMMLNELLRLFRRFNDIERLLMETMLVGSDAATVIDICSRFFQNPTLILNEALRVVALCESYKHDKADEAWRETEATGYISKSLLTAMNEAGLLHTLETSREVILVDLPDYPRRLVANVFSDGRRMISLCVDEVTSPLSSLQSALLMHLATMIGTYLQTNRRILGYQPVSFIDSVRALVRGEKADASDVKAFLRLRGWDAKDRYIVAAMRANGRDRELGTDRFNLQTAAARFPDAVILEDAGDLIAVIHAAPDSDAASWGLDDAFEQHLQEVGVTCGISMPFADFFLLHDECLLARAAIDISTKQGKLAGTQRFRDHLMDYLLDVCAEKIDPICLCDPDMLALDVYDRHHHTDFAQSVAVYLETGSNYVKAAERLFIHRNTLVYRLNRACELVGMDLTDPGVAVRMVVSYRILQRGKERAAG